MSKTIRNLTRSIGAALGLDVVADAVRSARELLGQPARVPVPVRVRPDLPRPRNGGRGRRR